MSLNSIHTNSAALIALQSLNKTNRELDAVQMRVTTGFRVANAEEDGAAFAVAQGLRGDVRGLEAIGEQLSKAKGTMAVANESARQISNTLADVRAVVTKLADDNVTGSQRTQYIGDYNALVAEITRFVAGASFSGINLLNTTTDVTVISALNGSTLTLNAFNLATDVTAKLTTITTAASAKLLLDPSTTPAGGLVQAEANIGTTMASLGADTRTLDNQISYVGIVSDATEEGISAIVDADLAKESARLQSLQIRQQLATQTLSIANQSPNILLSLFKQ